MKFTKAQVGFEHPARGLHKCGECKHFRARTQTCAIVTGRILARDWCRKFEAKKMKNSRRKLNSSRLTVPERHQLKIARDTLRMPDAMVDVTGGMTKAKAREIFRRLMAKARGVKNPPRKRRKGNSRRRLNYGTGNLFNFHGAFTEKAAAVAKEKSTPGAFIRPVWFKGGMRYGVLTKKNSRRNSVVWGGRKNSRKKKSRKNTVAWGVGDQKFVHQALKQLFPGKAIAQLTTAQMSQVVKLAQDLKTGKKNPVRKVPGGWRAIGARGRMSPVLPTQRDAEIYAESLRNPPPRPRRRNFQERITRGSRMALIHANESSGPFRIVLFVNNGETAVQSKKASTLAGARKVAKKMLDEHISRGTNPRGRRRNYADATELYTKFHGKGPARVTDTGLPTADYDDHPELGQLGRLVSLVIGDEKAKKPWKKKIEWKGGEAPELAAEPGGRQLYILGGSQDLGSFLDSLPVDAQKDELDLGFLIRIDYLTQKSFDNFQPVQYWHMLGEESGVRPRILYDRVKKRIHIIGGNYQVKPEGIVD